MRKGLIEITRFALFSIFFKRTQYNSPVSLFIASFLYFCDLIIEIEIDTMKVRTVLFTAIAAVCSIADSQACTSLLVGKGASVDGSTMITYAADSHTLYGELYFFPAASWPKNTMLDVRDWDSGKFLGKIPQVSETYSVLGNMNEHQVAISETTFGGRPELVNPKGGIDYGSLIYIALQRSKTAREAIQVMTTLVSEYGYYSSGESFSIADPDEIWIMEMIGKGPDVKGAVWVAVRIPDDCIAAHANQSRIHTFPLNDKDNCVYSPDVISFAREKNYFNGLNKEFSFANAYCPISYENLRACEARVWSFFRRFQPSTESYLSYIKGETKQPMPLYVKPEGKLSAQNLKDMMRDHYEGTEFDMTKDPGAGPFAVPYRWRPLTYKVDSVEYLNERAIATQQTGFSFVAQMRNWMPDPIGGVLWFGVDDAATSVYTPIYCGSKQVPFCYASGNGSLTSYSAQSFFWVNNMVANMAYSRYSAMIQDIYPVMKELETFFNQDIEVTDQYAEMLYKKDKAQCSQYITEQTLMKAQYAFDRWKKLSEFLLVRYIDGNIKKVENGRFLLTPEGHTASPAQPGYDERYYRSIVKESGEKLKVKEMK